MIDTEKVLRQIAAGGRVTYYHQVYSATVDGVRMSIDIAIVLLPDGTPKTEFVGYHWRDEVGRDVNLERLLLKVHGYADTQPAETTAVGYEVTGAERAVLDKLSEAWNMFVALPVQHSMAQDEFCRGIHVLQNQVAARPTFRKLGFSDRT